jgi:hypothetical protein
VSTTTVYGRMTADLEVTDDLPGDGNTDVRCSLGHLHFETRPRYVGAYLSRAGVLELRDLLDRWLARQETRPEEET